MRDQKIMLATLAKHGDFIALAIILLVILILDVFDPTVPDT